jgi:hypothetical protein
MRQHRVISILALLALVAGCAGPSTHIGGAGSGEDGSALPAARDFTGTWQGSYWNLPLGNSYGDEADCTLQIKEDATFTVKCTRSSVGANNIAKSSSWSGRAVTKGNSIVLQDDGGPWPSIVLRQFGNGSLYGTTLDPLVGATIEIEFERDTHMTTRGGGE